VDALIIASVAQFAIVECPAVFRVTEGLLVDVDRGFATDADFYQIPMLDPQLEIVAAARRHGLVANDGLEGVSVADCHSDRARVLVDELFLFEVARLRAVLPPSLEQARRLFRALLAILLRRRSWQLGHASFLEFDSLATLAHIPFEQHSLEADMF